MLVRISLIVVGLVVSAGETVGQGSAFTYQGRLAQSNAPFEGTCDFRFGVYDALEAGSLVAGFVTNQNTTVKSGLFTATLDFGASVFGEAPRWLEIAVRTNEIEPFSVLSPRQAIRPAPVALYALNAGAAGSVSSNFNGIVTATNGFVGGTNGAFTVDASGNVTGTVFTGSGSGLTNLTQSSEFGCLNVNRQALKHLATAIQTGATITTLSFGDSLISANFLNTPLMNRLETYFGEAGAGGQSGYSWHGKVTAPAYNTNDAYTWYPSYQVVPSGGYVTYSRFETSYRGNVLEVDYLQSPGAGTFKIQISTNYSGFADAPGLTEISADGPLAGVPIRITNAPALFQIRVVGLDGTVRFLGAAIYDYTSSGVHNNEFIMGGASMDRFLSLPQAITGPILRSWNPKIIFSSWLDSAAYMTTNLPNLKAFLNTWLTNSDVVFIGANPIEVGDLDVVMQNRLVREACIANGWTYFDGYNLFGSWANGVANGFLETGQNVHPTGLGDVFLASSLISWMLPFVPPNSRLPVFAGGSATVTNLVDSGPASIAGTTILKQGPAASAGHTLMAGADRGTNTLTAGANKSFDLYAPRYEDGYWAQPLLKYDASATGSTFDLGGDAESWLGVQQIRLWTAPYSGFPATVRWEVEPNGNFTGSGQVQAGSIKVGTTPPAAENGAIYYNSASNHFYGYANGSWRQLDN